MHKYHRVLHAVPVAEVEAVLPLPLNPCLRVRSILTNAQVDDHLFRAVVDTHATHDNLHSLGRCVGQTRHVDNTTASVALVEANPKMHARLTELIRAECEARGPSAVGRFSVHSDVVDSPEADLIVEAILEVTELKHRVLRAAEQRLTPNGILTSNTSSLSITHLD